ncbi:MAG: saccharopine dehydrogenase NADP-binding domain-containing protein [Phycisphaeraceae bacterium]|nr:saccharopine dehydrogenase NADP-binding domain-containing protein [Phycisphaeraceae bacterium]
MKPVVVLGSGKIGRTVISFLQGSGDYAVTAVDHAPALLEEAARLAPGCRTATATFDDAAALDRVLKGAFAVISCAPFFCNELIATRAKAAGVHYLDLTEDVKVTKAVKALAQGAATAFIPQCGLAPGFITIAATHVIEGIDELHEVRMRTGALPEHPNNALKYNLTWSTDGLINEYIQPCETVIDGSLTLVPALEGMERVMIGGIELEAFNTSGGLGTFAETLAGKVRHLNYKTMRYPGHNAVMKLLLHDLRFREHPDELKQVLERSIPSTHQDIVAIFTSAIGQAAGRLVQRSYAKIIRHAVIGGHHWTAIQITTAAGICAMLDLLREGKVPQRGFVRNEDASYADFIANRFGQHYA